LYRYRYCFGWVSDWQDTYSTKLKARYEISVLSLIVLSYQIHRVGNVSLETSNKFCRDVLFRIRIITFSHPGSGYEHFFIPDPS
jgi:hypothetical protein